MPTDSEQKNENLRPNILWICTDQQRYDTIGALGNRYVSTPNIDRLVEEGLLLPTPTAKARSAHLAGGAFLQGCIRARCTSAETVTNTSRTIHPL